MIRQRISAFFLVLVLALVTPLLSHAQQKPPTLKDTLDYIEKAKKDFGPAMSFALDQTKRIQNGEKPPFMEGASTLTGEQLLNHYEVLFPPKMQGEFFKLMASAVGMDGGSCIGTPILKRNYCHRCTLSLPFIGCVNEKIIASINYRFPTQWTEVAKRAYQSSVTSKELIKLSKQLRYSDIAQYAGLLDIKNFNPKEIIKSLPHEMLSSLELKQQWIQSQLGFAALGAFKTGTVDGNNLLNQLKAGILSVGTEKGVLGKVKTMPMEYRAGVSGDSKLGGQSYTFTDIPAYIPRMLDYMVLRKIPPIRIMPWFSVGIGSFASGPIKMPEIKLPDIKDPVISIDGLPKQVIHLPKITIPKITVPNVGSFVPSLGFGGGIELGPVTAHNIKFPAEPKLDIQGLQAIANMLTGKGSGNLSSITGGIGQQEDMGTASEVLKNPKFANIFNPFGGLGQTGGIGDLGKLIDKSGFFGGLVKFLPRSSGFNPFLDNHNSLLSFFKTGLLAGSYPVNKFGNIYALLDGRVADSVPAMMKLLKEPFSCSNLTTAAQSQFPMARDLMSSNRDIDMVLNAMMLVNPVMGAEFKKNFTNVFSKNLGLKPACMPFGLGEAGRPMNKTGSNMAVSALAKAVGFDGSFIERATTVVYNQFGGGFGGGTWGMKVGSPTYYKKIFQMAGVPLPPKTDKFLDLVNYGHTSRFEKNPRPKAASLPNNCTSPVMPQSSYGDLNKTSAPLDGPDQVSQFTAFRICPEGEPLNDDSAHGLILGFIWPIMKAFGAENLWNQRVE